MVDIDGIGEVAGEVAGAVLESAGDLATLLTDAGESSRRRRRRRYWPAFLALLLFVLLIGILLWAA